eukprot:6194487-Pleurochrysis_carterae.AAC.1
MKYATSNMKHNCVGLTHQRRGKQPQCKTYCKLVPGYLGTRKRNTKLQFAFEFPLQPGRCSAFRHYIMIVIVIIIATKCKVSLSSGRRIRATVKLRVGTACRYEKDTPMF